MKLYYHPISTTSRPVLLFAAESGIDLDLEIVDLFTGAQYQPPFEAINAVMKITGTRQFRATRYRCWKTATFA